jgi:hypothetical protein
VKLRAAIHGVVLKVRGLIARRRRTEFSGSKGVRGTDNGATCAGWPRWELLSGWYENAGAAFSEDEDDETAVALLREWSFSDDGGVQPWEMFPERFRDPSTWCSADVEP